jgi:SAM-dependent methyltransferase
MHRKNTFSDLEVAYYEKTRYRGLDQRLVHRREEKILEKIFGSIGLDSGTALDIPCGYGRFTGLLVRQGLTPVCSDYSISMVSRALRRTDERPSPAGFVADAKRRLPLKDSSADILLSMRFFHHIHGQDCRRSILSEFGRVTSRWVVVSFYQSSPIHRLQRHIRNLFKKTQRKIKMIDKGEFEQALEGSALKVERTYSLFRGIHSQKIALLKNESEDRPSGTARKS